MARPRAQIWAMSNAGDDESVVLNQLRDAARPGETPASACSSGPRPDGCELDDPTAWCAANPGLGHTVSEAAIRTALCTDPPAVFRTEVLCQTRRPARRRDRPAPRGRPAPTPAAPWTASATASPPCFDMAPDGQHATLAAAALTADGRPRVEIVKAWTSSDQARAELPEWLAKLQTADGRLVPHRARWRARTHPAASTRRPTSTRPRTARTHRDESRRGLPGTRRPRPRPRRRPRRPGPAERPHPVRVQAAERRRVAVHRARAAARPGTSMPPTPRPGRSTSPRRCRRRSGPGSGCSAESIRQVSAAYSSRIVCIL